MINLPLRDGSSYEVPEEFLVELEPLYPAVDIEQTVREMKGWLLGNPEKRKTKKGIKRFITNWLKSEQAQIDSGKHYGR